MAKNLIKDDKYVYIDSLYAEAYIASALFINQDDEPKESSIAYLSGGNVTTIGIMYIRFFNTEDYDRESVKPQTLNYPNMIEMQPTSISDNTTLTFNGHVDKYKILRFEKGDILMDSASKQSSTNVEKFVKLVLSGKIPKSLSYEAIYLAWKKNAQINNFGMKVPDVAIQTIISEMCRNPNNLLEQFRKVAGKGKIDPYSYQMLNMNTISAYSSVMSSLAFERFSEKLTTSFNMTRDNVEQKPSPLEKVLVM